VSLCLSGNIFILYTLQTRTRELLDHIMTVKEIFGIVFIKLFIVYTANAQIYDTKRNDIFRNGKNDSIEFVKGADVSFIPQIEDLGGIYKENGIPQDPLKIFKDHGFNYIRLKLWHTPGENYNNLNKILYMAKRIKDRELKFLLNFHYSDTWADPSKQYKPAAWRELTFETLKDSVYQYTKRVMRALYDQHTLPEMVQIGNEIISGILWNDGRVGGAYDTPQQWKNLGELINAGIRGVRESCDSGDSVLIMIHIDRGCNNSGCRWFYDNLLAQNVEFDIIGLSFYPWWHGTLNQVKANLNDLAVRYGKEIIIVETAYPWTLQCVDNRNNIVGSASQLHSGYPATVDGQTAFLNDLMKIIRNVKNQKGMGVFYWAPEYISVQPIGSPWENNALFDFYGNVLPSMDVFIEKPIDQAPINVTIKLNTSTLMDTLQEHHFVQLRGEVFGISYDTLPDGKKVTWDADSEIIFENVGGDYWETTFQMYPEDELSFKFWTGFNQSQGTFQRLGWEGPIIPTGGFSGNRRVIVAGERDTVITIQYYNSTGESKIQYWQPYESKDDSIAIYFRVNMGKVMASGRFNPDVNGPVTVRGDAVASGGSLDWNVSKVYLQREACSVNNGSFWSGVCYIPESALKVGNMLEYKFFIENDSQNGWENNISNRYLSFSTSLVQNYCDTTVHWVYFDKSNSVTRVNHTDQETQFHFQLAQNYPNPFNNQTRIRYHIQSPTFVNLNVYDIQGKLIITLVKSNQPAGSYSIIWNAQHKDGTSLVSGIYFISLETDYGSEIRKTLLLK
jgi:arabinogalactan endo-1,4-beta-galactosidase